MFKVEVKNTYLYLAIEKKLNLSYNCHRLEIWNRVIRNIKIDGKAPI